MNYVISLNPISKIIQSFLTPAEQANQSAVSRDNLMEYRNPCAYYVHDDRCKDLAVQDTDCGPFCKGQILRESSRLISTIVHANDRTKRCEIYHPFATYYSERGSTVWKHLQSNRRRIYSGQHIISKTLETLDLHTYDPQFILVIVTKDAPLETKYFKVYVQSDGRTMYKYMAGRSNLGSYSREEELVSRIAEKPAKPKRRRINIQTGPLVDVDGNPYQDDDGDEKNMEQLD